MAKVRNCGFEVSGFELQSRYYVHFQTNTFGKGFNPPFSPNYELNCMTTAFFFARMFGIK